jgi:5-methylcytosine-specific restriction enzyme subunit McrC
MTVVKLAWDTDQTLVELSAEQGNGLAESNLVVVTRSRHKHDGWIIKRHRGWAGTFLIGDVQLKVDPKLSISRLLFLAGYARNPDRYWHDTDVEVGVEEGMMSAVAQILWRQGERALMLGPIQGYHAVEETSYTLRGRLRVAEQLRRRHGLPMPMEISYDDFTIDVAENRILRAVINRVLAEDIDAKSRWRLAALRARLAGVTPVRDGQKLPDWQPTRLNRRYHNVLYLAQTIWELSSPEHVEGDLMVNGFGFNLEKIYEDFVCGAFARSLRERGFRGEPKTPYPGALDTREKLEFEGPDLAWIHDGHVVAIVDAKYKSDVPKADYYQLLAYCTTFGVKQAHLVYAKGAQQSARYAVKRSDIEIFVHALDLAQQPAEILARVGGIADQIIAAAATSGP